MFGPAEGEVGSTFQAYAVFDVTFGPNNSNIHGRGGEAITGGAFFGNTSPALYANFTFGGKTITFDPSYWGQIAGLNPGGDAGEASAGYFVLDGTTSYSVSINIHNYLGNSMLDNLSPCYG